jgi:DNA primase
MRDELSALTVAAARFFEDQLAGSWVPGYLASRGFDADTLRPWGIGYAPAEWTALTDYARDLGFGHEALVIAGLARRSARGSLIDLFRDRLMFPVRGPDGTVAGFIGRAPPGADQRTNAPAARHPPVYLNTPASPLYRKGALLFGLHEATPALAAGARPVLAEGPLDALAITLAGKHQPPAPSRAPSPSAAPSRAPGPPLPNVSIAQLSPLERVNAAGDALEWSRAPVRYAGIAPCGTALTPDQVRLFAESARVAGVTVAFDADRAGRRAAVRAYDLLRPAAGDIAIAPLPDGADPAGYFREHGPTALGRLLDASGPLADLVVDNKLAGFDQWLDFTDGKFLALRAVAPLVADLPPAQVARQVARVADHLGLSYAEVTRAVTAALDLLFTSRHVL